MSILTILLIVILVAALTGGWASGPTYSNYGYGGAGLIVVVLIVLLLMGRL